MQDKCFGVMLDCSRDAVMKVEKVKEFANTIKAFGYNALLLYTEDTYEVSGEPYFGYMRGGYTQNELKELDAYLSDIGIELIPCIQTLAHLLHIFKWKPYAGICDTGNILLVDDEKTYELIENIFKTLDKTFTSRRVNIGMDEAHMLGLGKYLDLHGYHTRFELLKKHLKRVSAIAAKYGFKPMMWSDMYFRVLQDGAYYGIDNRCEEIVMTDEVASQAPPDVDLVYWDYYNDRNFVDRMVQTHKKFPCRLWFAGGAWSWFGFVPSNAFTQKTMLPAMEVCRDKNIDDIFITMWGDGGKECSFFTLLPSLYAIKKTYDGLPVDKEEFSRLTGENYDDLMSLDGPNELYDVEDPVNPSKYMFYNDLLLGICDTLVVGGECEKLATLTAKYKAAAKRSKKYSYIFESMASFASVLSVKYELGVRLRRAYKEKDDVALAECLADMKKLPPRIKAFYKAFGKLWETENKPFGFEVHDQRLGGMIKRIEHCIDKLQKYIAGTLKTIEELEVDLLDFHGNGKEFTKKPVHANNWKQIVTCSYI